ncbi:MAG: DHH family phosphoesterase, partial [Chitinophagaceae bacterium]|nr:DHH family phosphoesterase [Anaerolineae bacterium]
MEIILTHNNADFDAIAALLGAHKLFPSAVPILSSRLNRNVAEFVTLYQNGLPFMAWDDLQGEQVKRIILVDTQKSPELHNLTANTPVYIIDHHPKHAQFAPHETFTGEEVGATVTLLVEQMRQQGIMLSSLEATLLALGIYEDTGSLTYNLTTPRDITAAAWLLEQGAVLDTVRRFLTKPLNEEQQALLEKLLKNA